MKAIIVEVKGKHAAVLTDDGVVSKIKNRNYVIGQEIVIKNNNNLIKIAASAAAAIMIFVTPAWAYLTPYSYVSLDVNPSFEFSINRFDRVLTVKAINDDGGELSKDINIDGLKNKEIQNAVKSVLSELKNQGYIVEGEGSVIVAASSKTQDKTDMLSEKLRAAVKEEVGKRQETEETEETEVKTIKSPEEPKKTEESEDIEKSLKIQETETNKESETLQENGDFTDNEKSENTKKPEKPKQSDKSEKPEKPEKSEKPEKPEKPEKNDKSDKEENREKTERSDEPDKSYKPDKPDKSEKSKTEQSEKQKEKIDVKVIEVTKKEVEEAKKLGVTPGKLNLVEKLSETAKSAGHKIEADEWLNKSVQEINAKTKEYKEEAKQKENKNNKKDSDKSNSENKNDKERDSRDNGSKKKKH